VSEVPSIRQSVRSLLDGQLSRRKFVRRMSALGFAVASSTTLADIVLAKGAGGDEPGSRRLFNRTGGELMAEFLRDWDVKYVFGLGGSEEVGFLDALVDRPELQYILAIHESAAVAMADGYARSCARTGFVNLHSVAGASYALGQIVNASKDRTPLVITVGRQSTDMRGRDAFLEAENLHTLPGSYSRWSWDVLRSDTIPDVLRRSFLTSQLPPAGPTFLTFSRDLWENTVAEAEIIGPFRSGIDIDLQPDQASIVRLADMLLAAEFPLLVAGNEMSEYGGADELAELAELLGASVMADVPASHSPISFPTTHPNYSGMFSLDANVWDSYDLFWSVGGTMFSLFRQPEKPLLRREATIIHTSADGRRLGRNYPVDLAAVGRTDRVLAAVLAELRTRPQPARRIRERQLAVTNAHRHRHSRLQQAARAVWDQAPVAPERLAVELNQRLPGNAIVVCELATSDLYNWQYIDYASGASGRRHLTSGGGCLGWGIGAAIGARIGQPNRPVVLLVGDGSFQFGVQALWSAARYKVPVAIIIWNNKAYQANRRALHSYGGRAAKSGRYPGCYLGSPEIDHVRIAAGYGVDGEQVSDPDELGAAIDRCLDRVAGGEPYVLDVHIQARFSGAESTWHSEFSVAALAASQSK